MPGKTILISWAAVCCAIVAAHGQERAHSEIESPFAEFVEPDFPFFTQTLDARGFGARASERNLTPRGIILDLGEGLHACFDPDLLRVSLIWRENAEGEYLSMNGMGPGSYRVPGKKSPAGQSALPVPLGEPLCTTGIYPGWCSGEVTFDDPREKAPDPQEAGLGPVPEKDGRWEGLYLAEDRVFLAYTVSGTRVIESIRSGRVGKGGVPIRAFRIGPHAGELSVILDESGAMTARCESGEVRKIDGRLVVSFSASDDEKDHVVVLASPKRADAVVLAAKLAKPGFDAIESPGAPRWPETVTTAGRISESGDAYVIDEIPIPVPNPWKRNVRFSGFDFFPDGRAALCTFDGDVWIARGIDADLKEVSWRRYASGLHEPLGLQVVDDAIYVFDRNGIVRLHDVNGDGEADFYENFSNVVAQTAESREFANDLVKKPGGGFYIAKGGQVATSRGKYNGTVVEISPDGRDFHIVARGLRQPYIGVDPVSGTVTSSDQQGHWVPATPVRLIEPGSYHGFIPTLLKGTTQTETITEPPLWIPHIVNQSGASHVWLRNSQMGPLDGSLLHIGYNRPELFKIYFDDEGAHRQGAAASVLTGFPCALLKGAVGPVDGQLYTCGFRIWGTALDQISGFFRVRYTGAESRVPLEVRSSSEGVLMRFGFELDEAIAMNPASYTVERWNYRRTASYGSGHYRLDGAPGQEMLPVASVYLSQDKRALFLGIPDMQPAHSMRVTYRLAMHSDLPAVQSAYLTIHEVRDLDLADSGFEKVKVDLTVTEAVAAAAAAPEPSIEEGKKAAMTFGCVACHTADGSQLASTPGLVVGPTWKGLWGSKRELGDGTIVKKVDAVYLKESILEPGNKVAKGFENTGVGMPSYLGVVQDWQIDSVILYIESLQ